MKGWWVRYKFCSWRVDGVFQTGADRAVVSLGVSAKFRRFHSSKLPAKAPETALARVFASVDRAPR